MYNPSEDPGWDDAPASAASPAAANPHTWRTTAATTPTVAVAAATSSVLRGGASKDTKTPEEVEKELRAKKGRELPEVCCHHCARCKVDHTSAPSHPPAQPRVQTLTLHRLLLTHSLYTPLQDEYRAWLGARKAELATDAAQTEQAAKKKIEAAAAAKKTNQMTLRGAELLKARAVHAPPLLFYTTSSPKLTTCASAT
jgi:hypothetical protein